LSVYDATYNLLRTLGLRRFTHGDALAASSVGGETGMSADLIKQVGTSKN